MKAPETIGLQITARVFGELRRVNIDDCSSSDIVDHLERHPEEAHAIVLFLAGFARGMLARVRQLEQAACPHKRMNYVDPMTCMDCGLVIP